MAWPGLGQFLSLHGLADWGIDGPSFSFQKEDCLAAAALRETLPALGLADATDFEAAVRALGGPVKLQQFLIDLPLYAVALRAWRFRWFPRRRWRRFGSDAHSVQRGDLLPAQLLAGPRPAQQPVSVGHVSSPAGCGGRTDASGGLSGDYPVVLSSVPGRDLRLFRTTIVPPPRPLASSHHREAIPRHPSSRPLVFSCHAVGSVFPISASPLGFSGVPALVNSWQTRSAAKLT